MLSKFLRNTSRVRSQAVLVRKAPQPVGVRWMDLIPPSQYDVPIPKKLQLGYVIREYWETIPLFVVTAFSLGLMCGAILWACRNKVDVVFTSRSRENISRTMDLRNPTIHKLMIIHQRYEPWNEMQDVLDKMITAEKRALVRAQTCAHP
ncbi:uncharacterized protein LOC115450672 [Manduca sexta]|uniref:Uncharacterized protein n=1 Tax=Manduca sexta TaxID=7130 RepID=A0A922CX11_MANSE|nr:uncharacterized protein LOC115450672 [Manduca sexta]KAG6461031.1 hypothetical protein O3G_MSEX012390 [Manduca sexta]